MLGMRKMRINGLILLFSCPSWENEMGGATALLCVSRAHTVNLFIVSWFLQDVSGIISDHSQNSLLTFLKGPNLFGIILIASQE